MEFDNTKFRWESTNAGHTSLAYMSRPIHEARFWARPTRALNIGYLGFLDWISENEEWVPISYLVRHMHQLNFIWTKYIYIYNWEKNIKIIILSGAWKVHIMGFVQLMYHMI